MFKESKPVTAGGARLTSPLVRRRMPHTTSAVYMSPQTTRKNSGRGFGKMKKKASVPDGMCPQSPPPAPECGRAFNFSEDPKNMQISEHVSSRVCGLY